MKDQVLKLCRRLKRCTLEDIVQFTEIKKEQAIPIIYYLIDNNLIEERAGIYSPIISDEPISNANTIYFKQQYHSDEEIDFIIKGYCLDIPVTKIKHFVKCKESALSEFYRMFRKKIYDRQYNELLNNYFNRPQNNHFRMFFEQMAYFYIYNYKIYVIDKPLRAPFEDLKSKPELAEFRRVYNYLRRAEDNTNKQKYLHHHLSEEIWRRNKTFDELYSDLKSLLFS